MLKVILDMTNNVYLALLEKCFPCIVSIHVAYRPQLAHALLFQLQNPPAAGVRSGRRVQFRVRICENNRKLAADASIMI